MRDRDVIHMMQRCAEEISRLRQRISMLEPKARAYDTVSQILALRPQPSVGMEEDLVWRLRKSIEEEEKRLADKSPPAGEVAQ